MKRKLPAWFSETEAEAEMSKMVEPIPDAKDRARLNAQLAVEILENGLMRAYHERMDDQLLPADDSDPEDEDAFDLSQSSVVDVMTSDEALEIMGAAAADVCKQDRKQIINSLKTALLQ